MPWPKPKYSLQFETFFYTCVLQRVWANPILSSTLSTIHIIIIIGNSFMQKNNALSFSILLFVFAHKIKISCVWSTCIISDWAVLTPQHLHLQRDHKSWFWHFIPCQTNISNRTSSLLLRNLHQFRHNSWLESKSFISLQPMCWFESTSQETGYLLQALIFTTLCT